MTEKEIKVLSDIKAECRQCFCFIESKETHRMIGCKYSVIYGANAYCRLTGTPNNFGVPQSLYGERLEPEEIDVLKNIQDVCRDQGECSGSCPYFSLTQKACKLSDYPTRWFVV